MGDSGDGLAVAGEGGGFADGFGGAVTDFGFEVVPEWFELGEYLCVAAIGGDSMLHLHVMLTQDVVHALVVVPFAAFNPLGEKRRSSQQATPGHDTGKFVGPAKKSVDVGRCAYIAVVDHGMSECAGEQGELLHIDSASISLAAGARMHGDVDKRHAVDNVDNVGPSVVSLHAKAHLHREIKLWICGHGLCDAEKDVGTLCHCSSAAFSGLKGKWASEVEVYGTMTLGNKGVDERHKLIFAAEDNLRNEAIGAVGNRSDIAEVAAPRLAFLYTDERRKICVYAGAVDPGMALAPGFVGIALQRGGEEFDFVHGAKLGKSRAKNKQRAE